MAARCTLATSAGTLGVSFGRVVSPRRIALVMGAVACAVLALYCVTWAGVSLAQEGSSDFSSFYVGGVLLRTGHVANLYSDAAQAAVRASLVPGSGGNLPFVNPPPAAAVMAPISLLPFQLAYRLWQIAQLLCLCAAVLIASRVSQWSESATARRAWVVVVPMALAAPATLALGLVGQWDGVSALGVAGAYALWRRDHGAAGAVVLAISAALAKPHLALGFAAFVLGWRDRRVVAGALAGVTAVALAALLTAGPAGVVAFAHADLADASRWPLASLLGFTGLLGSWMGDGSATQALAMALTLAACAACAVLGDRLRRGAPLEVTLAAAALLSLVASPHLLSHDLVLLAPVFAGLAAWASRQDAGEWPGATSLRVLCGWLGLCLVAVLDLASTAPAPPGRLVPVALVALAGALTWPRLLGRPELVGSLTC
ncbi:MAG: glycosyltransferase 87 family protein [Candidatus Dormibacteria bacterium]